jgi:formylglycine-generating enzyme required for sulfatase activity
MAPTAGVPGQPASRPAPTKHRATEGSHGADSVSWFDAMAFCHRLSAKSKIDVTLPTEF